MNCDLICKSRTSAERESCLYLNFLRYRARHTTALSLRSAYGYWLKNLSPRHRWFPHFRCGPRCGVLRGPRRA
jgi:hypothetical protein